jgi:hypothetical protein
MVTALIVQTTVKLKYVQLERMDYVVEQLFCKMASKKW